MGPSCQSAINTDTKIQLIHKLQNVLWSYRLTTMSIALTIKADIHESVDEIKTVLQMATNSTPGQVASGMMTLTNYLMINCDLQWQH